MFLIKSENNAYIKGATWGAKTDADQFTTVADAVERIRSFHGKVMDQNIEETGATVAMSGNPRDFRIYNVVKA